MKSVAVGDFLAVPTAPGIGVTLAPGAQARLPVRERPLRARLIVCGSVVNQE